MTKQQQRAAVAGLFEWMRLYQPNVYLGLVKRFTPPDSSLGDFSTTLSTLGTKVLDAATNFVNGQGFDKLLNAAQPFIETSLQKKQLDAQLKLAQAGYTTQTTPTGTTAVVPIAAAQAPASSSSTFFGGSSSDDGGMMKWLLIGGAGLAAFTLLRPRGRA